jgi:hypothetical protein
MKELQRYRPLKRWPNTILSLISRGAEFEHLRALWSLLALSGRQRLPSPVSFFHRNRRLVCQLRGKEVRERVPRLFVGALLVSVRAELGEAMGRTGINLDLIGNAGALQLP